jgi:hypothetical protein
MTLQSFFDYIGQNPFWALVYFLGIPVLALINGVLAKDKAAYSPWAYNFMFLIYFISIPGIFAVALNVYFFFFQRGDIMQTNLMMQVLPIFSMLMTIFIISKSVALKFIPGFDKITALWMIIFAAMAFMWLLDRIRIMVFVNLPFQYLIGIFLVIFGIMYWGWQKISK